MIDAKAKAVEKMVVDRMNRTQGSLGGPCAVHVLSDDAAHQPFIRIFYIDFFVHMSHEDLEEKSCEEVEQYIRDEISKYLGEEVLSEGTS